MKQPVSIEFSREHKPGPNEKTVRAVCRPNCFGYCAHDVTVRDGKIVQSQPHPFPDERYNRICLCGLSNLQRVYDPDRIKYPMKRVGERGSGEWERIRWDEAITTITNNWKEPREKYGDTSVAFGGGSGNYSGISGGIAGMMSRLANVLGVTTFNHSVDAAVHHGEMQVAGPMFMLPTNGPKDLENAKTVVILGFNVTESQIHYWHFVQDAKKAGAKIIVVDPVFTNTAANADQFIPIRPGGDPALLLSLTHCVVRDGREDREFMRAKTVAPYMVRDDNGKFLRMSDLGHDDDRAVVMAEDGTIGAAGDVENPIMHGRYEIEGISVTNAMELLKEHLEDYTPEKAEEITDSPAETIEELYEQIISGPATTRSGYGGQAHNNGTMVGKAMMTWAAVTGMVGRPGADVGTQYELYRGVNFGWTMPTGQAAPVIEAMIIQELISSGTFKGEPYPIKSMYFYQGNWVGNAVDQNGFKKNVIDNLDFIVTADLAWTDTARISDIVLPATHFYEVEDIVIGMGAHPYLQYSEKAVEPAYEAKSDSDIARLVAEKMGVGECFDKTDHEYMAEMIDSDYSKAYNVTLERLRDEGAIQVLDDPWYNFGGD